MANQDTPFGFRPIQNYDGTYAGGLVKVAWEDENAVATFIGDLVRLEGSADADGNPTVDQSADEDTDHFGVVVAFDPDRTNLERKHRLASTARTGYVVPAVNGQLFVVQADSSASVAVTDIGNTADIVVGSGNTTTGVSAMELLASNIGTGANLRIERLYPAPDNALGETHALLVVTINENSFGGDGTAS